MPLELRQHVVRDRLDVVRRGGPGLLALDDEFDEILVEQVADDLDQQVWLLVERLRLAALARFGLRGRFLDRRPLRLQPRDIPRQLFLTDTFGGRSDDDTGLGGHDVAEDFLESFAFGVGELAADPRRTSAGNIDEVAAGERELRCQAGTLVTDRVLADLDQYLIAWLECLLDLARVAAQTCRIPVHFTGVEHTVSTATDVDERCLHAGQNVLHASEVDIADHRRRGAARDEVLHQNTVFEHCDLRGVAVVRERLLANDHHAVDGFAPCQELGFGQNRWTPAPCVAAVPTSLPLGFETGRAGDALNLVLATATATAARLVPRFALMHDGVGGIVLGGGTIRGGFTGAAPTTATTATTARAVGTVLIVVRVFCGGIGRRTLCRGLVQVALRFR